MTWRRIWYDFHHIPQSVILAAIGMIWLRYLPPELLLAIGITAFWFSREAAQAEARFIKTKPYTARKITRWQMWFRKEAWNKKSRADWMLASLAAFVLIGVWTAITL